MRLNIIKPQQFIRGESNVQAGSVLPMSLMILLVLTLAAVSGMESTILSERLASNTEVKAETFQSAESCLQVSRANAAWHLEAINEDYQELASPSWPKHDVAFDGIDTTNSVTLSAFRTVSTGGEVTIDAASYTTRLEISCESIHDDFNNQRVTLIQGYKRNGAG